MVAAGRITFDDDLPIAARHDALAAAIATHQVVIVAGETGSGKSTQLPKICLELGRGVDGLIGHTQPRRVAARSIAERVASELGIEIGNEVGYTVRFNDRVGDDTLIRVMTDGILLAEIHRDRQLRRYDTLIIDEAHERSLNIDFLLGYLRQLLPRRPELKVIITSATIDTERFAAHFDVAGRPAPIVEVEGRTYPVDVRYRPFGVEPHDERDQVQAIIDAVDELDSAIEGDVLVFLSGEREIHDAADAMRRTGWRDTEVLPLYARLSSAEQHRIFEPHRARRIVLSTNVAETSLTVPGVRAVVDTGTARISRYSRRLKVQRLPIEEISRASADQRAGRCGRLGPGVCIRLFGEDSFAQRPEFTDPEILRTNLASVILQMTSIGLGDVEAFPFLEPPDRSSIRDGYALLHELGAIEEPDDNGVRHLTSVGRRLARLPVDPRLGRMVLEAERFGCVREVLVVAAALSIQDPRERPHEQRATAESLHRRFDVDGSDLLSMVALWDYLRAEQRARSSNQFRVLCRTEHLNYLRVREWHDLYSQLRQVAADLGIRAGTAAGHPDHVHRAVLAGLLSHLGVRDEQGRQFRGARGASFVIGAGSVLAKRSPRWVMAAELVETNRLWARKVAAVQPEWAEQAGAHLIARSYGEPRWDRASGRAVVTESVTLFGLPLVSGRLVALERVDPLLAREMFIRHALVDRDADELWLGRQPFLRQNADFLARVDELEARVRRGHLLDGDALVEFYDRVLPEPIRSTRAFDTWWRKEGSNEPSQLALSVDDLRDPSGAAIRLADYPDVWTAGGLRLDLIYRFEPGHVVDGVTVQVPLTALNQVDPHEFTWSIPAYRADVVRALVRTLPKDVRRQLIPLAETTDAASRSIGTVSEAPGPLVDAVACALATVSGVAVRPEHLHPERIPPWLTTHFAIVDEAGEVVDAGDDLAAIRRRQAGAARVALASAAPIAERRDITDWDVGDLPRTVRSVVAGRPVVAYPALLDDGDRVSLRVLSNADLQARVMRAGVRRLLLLTAPPSTKAAQRRLTATDRLAIAGSNISLGALAGDCVIAAVDTVLADHELPWTADSFEVVRRDVRTRGTDLATGAFGRAVTVVTAAAAVRNRLAALTAEALAPSAADATGQLDRLTRPGFVLRAGLRRLDDVERYVNGIRYRLDRLTADVGRDRRRMAEIQPLETRLGRYLGGLEAAPPSGAADVGWLLEELRLATFAQPLRRRTRAAGSSPAGTAKVSTARIAAMLDALGA